MILPTKGVPRDQALVAIGADLITILDEAKTVSRLWEEFRSTFDREVGVTFDWFVLSLDLLYAMGAIDFDRGRLRRATADERRGEGGA